MLKKITIILILILSSFFLMNNSINACSTVDGCLEGSKLVPPGDDLLIEWWFKDKVLDWTTKIAWFLWLMAVWAIVFGSFMMVISTWEEEKIKKAKDMIKWAILWFLWIILAASLIALVVSFMYDLWKK